MKTRIINLFCAACVACAFTACSNDDDKIDVVDGGDQNEKVEDALVKMTISQDAVRTYASVNDKTAEPYEINPGTTIDLYIFDDWQVFEKHETLTLTPVTSNTWETPEFSVASGNKYFYAFAHIPTGAIPAPAKNSNRMDFEKNIINLSAGGIDDITQQNKFFMGTLHGSVTAVAGTGTPGSPETITLRIGRLSAKVYIDKTITPVVEGALAGSFAFANGSYRILNEATQYYTVGQWSNGFRTQQSQVTTPHYSLIDANLTGLSTYVKDFQTTTFTSIGDVLYTTENTNVQPRKGTNTAIQIKYKYEPGGAELYDVSTNQNNASLASDGTFWVATMKDLRKVMYNGDPTGRSDVQSAEEYKGGNCYYIVYLADQSEKPVASLMYSVIRNHYYEVAVNSVSRLGNSDPDEIPGPEEEIDKEEAIKVIIDVYDWFEIKQAVDL